jgi:hypothetical protein
MAVTSCCLWYLRFGKVTTSSRQMPIFATSTGISACRLGKHLGKISHNRTFHCCPAACSRPNVALRWGRCGDLGPSIRRRACAGSPIRAHIALFRLRGARSAGSPLGASAVAEIGESRRHLAGPSAPRPALPQPGRPGCRHRSPRRPGTGEGQRGARSPVKRTRATPHRYAVEAIAAAPGDTRGRTGDTGQEESARSPRHTLLMLFELLFERKMLT